MRLIWITGTTRDFSWSRPGNPLQSPGESRWYFRGNCALLEARIHHSRIAQASIRLVITKKTQMVCVPSLCVFSSFFENLSAKNSTPLLGIELSDPSNTRANYPEATGSGRRPCNFTTGFDHHAAATQIKSQRDLSDRSHTHFAPISYIGRGTLARQARPASSQPRSQRWKLSTMALSDFVGSRSALRSRVMQKEAPQPQ